MTETSPPETIGPYRILRRLGRGGMADVYIGSDQVTGEEHAIKLMQSGTDRASRFNQEYEALTRLNHPGIVRVYQYGFEGPSPWFSMEHIAGEPLHQWMRRFGRPGAVARHQELMRAGAFLAAAIDYIHTRGLIHRDLKGNNVLVLPDGRVKLLDFGTAHIRDGLRQLTRPGEFIGTLAYASPEQFRDADLDHRVDLYALGVLLYRLVTGFRPFRADDPASLARLIVRSAPKPPSEMVEDMPTGLEDLILSLLAKKPEHRPATAHEVAQRLEDLSGAPLDLPGWGASIRRDRLAGREAILRQLRQRLRSGSATLILIGRPGSDRVQIGDALHQEALADGQQCITVSFQHDPTVKALTGALARAAHRVKQIQDQRVVQAIATLNMFDRRGADIALRNRTGLHTAVTSVLVGIVRAAGPTRILIHDLHRADAPARELLSHLHRIVSRGSLAVGWLLTAEPGIGRDADHGPIRFTGAVRVPLPPLDVPEVALRVGAMLDRRPPPIALAHTLHRASGGQPTWVETLVTRLVESGSIRLIGEDGNRLEWEVTGELELPDDAVRGLRGRIAQLPAVHRRILQTVASVGSPCPIVAVRDALSWSGRSVLIPLRDLAHDGWIRVENSHIHLDQPLLSHVITQGFEAERRWIIAHNTADRVAALPFDPHHVPLLLAAGRPVVALHRALDGANRLLDELQTVEALGVLSHATALREPLSESEPELLARSLLLHAKCLLMVRPVDPALARSLATARRLAQAPATRFSVQLTLARLQRTLGHLSNHLKQLQKAVKIAEQAEDPRLMSMAACFEADALRLEGRSRDAGRKAQRGLELAREAGEAPIAWAQVCNAALRVSQGRLSEAEPQVREALATFDRIGHRRGTWSALPTLIAILRMSGRYTEALGLVYGQLPAARRCQEPSHTVRLLLAAAEVEADLHRLGRAQEHIDEIDMLVRKGEQLDIRLAASVVRGRVLLASGHLRPADVTLGDAHHRARAAGLPATSELARALQAEVRAAEGDVRGARDLFASAVLGLLGAGDVIALLDGTLSRLRALGAHESPDQLTKPIQTYLSREPLAVPQIAQTLAHAVHAHAHHRRAEARASALAAQSELDLLNEHLDDTDRAALRLHPWSRKIRMILK